MRGTLAYATGAEWNVDWCTCAPLLWISALFLCLLCASSSDLRRSCFFSNLSCSLQCRHVISRAFGSSSWRCENSFFWRVSPVCVGAMDGEAQGEIAN